MDHRICLDPFKLFVVEILQVGGFQVYQLDIALSEIRNDDAVQQNAVQCPGIGGDLPETAVLEQCPGNAEIGEQLARLTIKVVQRHLVWPRIFNCAGVFMLKTILPSEMNEKQVDIHQKKRLQW